MKKTLLAAFCMSQLFAASVFAQVDEGFGCVSQLDKRIVHESDFTYLALGSCDLQDKDMKTVAGFLKQHTDVMGVLLDDNDRLTGDGISELADNPSLIALSLNNVSDAASGVSKITSLRFVSLNDNYLDTDELASLASLPNLEMVSINKGYIGTQGAKTLALNPHLRFLSLDNNEIGPNGAKALASLPALLLLSINGNYIKDEGAVALAATNRLELLSMESNHIGDKGADAIASMTPPDSPLIILDHNDITDTGAISIANKSTNTFLLNISHNLLSEVGVNALRKAQDDGRIFLLSVNGYSPEEDMMKNRNLKSKKVKEAISKLCNRTNYTFCKIAIKNSVKL